MTERPISATKTPGADAPTDADAGLTITLPTVDERVSQDEEWCHVTRGGRTTRVRFHDYGQIFSTPGLYEELFHRRLECRSPAKVATLLRGVLDEDGVAPGSLRGLDVGAGNGLVGQALRDVGVGELVAVDILPEAAEAAHRDRRHVYRDYVVGDLTALDDDRRARLRAIRPNLLVTVAALGFDDIPAEAFAAAWDLVETPAWVAFNIKDAFLDPEADQSGFSRLIRRMIDAGLFELRTQAHYRHRLSVSGDPLMYVALVGKKTGDIPDDWLD